MKNNRNEEICTVSGKPIDESTREINPATGMQHDYIILCPAERARGFVRPYRDKYRHVGARPKYPLRDLTSEEHEDYDKFEYVSFEIYPESESPVTGKFWTKAQLASGCNGVTVIGSSIAETFARNPSFYGGSFCAVCKKHFSNKEFVWEADKTEVGS